MSAYRVRFSPSPRSRVTRGDTQCGQRGRVRSAPTLRPTLQRLVGRPARPEGSIERAAVQRLFQPRRQVLAVAARHGASNLRVFGSVARGTATPTNDVDLMVDLAPETGLLGLARTEHELTKLLRASVDVGPASDLEPSLAQDVLAEAVAP
jgi:predicted nucleotidyltransferase